MLYVFCPNPFAGCIWLTYAKPLIWRGQGGTPDHENKVNQYWGPWEKLDI